MKTATSRSDVADGGAHDYVDGTPARGCNGSDGNTNYIMKMQCHVHGAHANTIMRPSIFL